MPERLSTAEKCGFDATIDASSENVQERINEITGGKGCLVTVEATGSPAVAPTAMKVTAELGKVILLGSPRGTAVIDLYFV